MADEQEQKQDAPQVPATQQRAPVAVSIGAKGLTPTTLDELWKMSSLIASSDLAPKQMKGNTGNVAVAIQLGLELGMSPMAAIQNIAVVNGRPSVWGAGMLALVEGSGLLEQREEWFSLGGQRLAPGQSPVTDGSRKFPESYTAHCLVKRYRRPAVEYTFSVGDAMRAGLWDKEGPWRQYPSRMLMWRSRGFACNDEFGDVLKGLVVMREEAIDITPDVDEPARRPVVSVEDILKSQATAKDAEDRKEPTEAEAEDARDQAEAMKGVEPEHDPHSGYAPEPEPKQAARAEQKSAAKPAAKKSDQLFPE